MLAMNKTTPLTHVITPIVQADHKITASGVMDKLPANRRNVTLNSINAALVSVRKQLGIKPGRTTGKRTAKVAGRSAPRNLGATGVTARVAPRGTTLTPRVALRVGIMLGSEGLTFDDIRKLG